MEKSAKHAAARRGYRLAKCCSLCFYADATKEGIECAFNASNKDDQRPASAIHVCDEFVQISVRQEAQPPGGEE